MQARTVEMRFDYSAEMEVLPDAYERLLLDAIQGDASLFTRADEIELAWGIIDPIAAEWQCATAAPLAIYEAGSWGPREADVLLALAGRAWYRC